MAVPNFQLWFLPLLKELGDGKDRKMSDLYEDLADVMGLSSDDRAQVLQSGNKPVFENRIAWARTYLLKAGLLESPSRGLIRITERGKGILNNPPPNLNVKFLLQFPEFAKFHVKPDNVTATQSASDLAEESPFDTLERVHGELQKQLADEILERIKKSSPAFFERVVIDLLLAMGYGGSREDAGKTIGKSSDGGIDGVINEDRLGLDSLYVQAKRWDNQTVGRPAVQAFAGSLDGVRARKGVFMTTSTFSADAHNYVGQIEKKIVLIDGPSLASLMIQHNVGVGIDATYQVKRLDSDYFPE